MKIWITGANGFLGKAVQYACRMKKVPFVATFKQQVDLSSLDQVNCFLKTHSQDPITHIVNCAALAHVDQAEENIEEAFKINVLGPENLGKLGKGTKIIHFSTEYIFNGSPSQSSFKEGDIPHPIGVYATTKREGEMRLLDVAPEACIVRTSWLFGGEGKTFLSSLFERIRKEKILRVDADQKGRATYIADLASSVFFFFTLSGIFHFANQEEASRYDIGMAMQDCARKFGIPIACEEILPTSSNAFAQISKRPTSCILDTSKIEKIQGYPIRSWREGVADLVQRSLAGDPICR